MNLPLTALFILSLCLTTIMARAISLSKPGCLETCGNVKIPYPFGIGSNCSANSWFDIVCQNSTTPLLTVINMEVLDFSLEHPYITVNLPVTPMNCSHVKQTQSLATSLQGSPFHISSGGNGFAVLGCHNLVSLREIGSAAIIGGCNVSCDSDSRHDVAFSFCMANMPPQLQELRYTYQSIQPTTKKKGFCGYAFPVARYSFGEIYRRYTGLQSHASDPYDRIRKKKIPHDQQFVSAPLLLFWKLHKLVDYDFSYCDSDSLTYDSFVSRCVCFDEYEGNPYLPGGCSYTTDYTTDKHGHKNRNKIVLVGIASGLGALILLLGAWRSKIAIRKRINANRKRKFFKRNGGLLLEKQLSSTNNGLERTKLFSSRELAKATDHYNENRVLGRGGQGTVYKGMLTDGRIVAVKKSKRVDKGDLEFFINEVVILSQINHRNIVKLLGCCLETEVPLLVYEFIPNGTLFQHIHEPSDDFILTWEMRLRIARDIAGALFYLHSATSAPIYHRDIKSINILLDDKYRAKVADFGTSRTVAIDQTHLTTRVLGTFGYLDPEYFRSSQLNEKSDVYSFGVVMVELLTGEKAVSSVRAEEGMGLATYFLHSMEDNHLFEILDPRVLEEGGREEIVAVAKLAKRCLHLNGKRRPTMKAVVVELEGIQMHKEGSASLKNQDDNIEYHSIVIGEPDDFSSISSGSMHSDSDTITAAYSPEDHHPFLEEP